MVVVVVELFDDDSMLVVVVRAIVDEELDDLVVVLAMVVVEVVAASWYKSITPLPPQNVVVSVQSVLHPVARIGVGDNTLPPQHQVPYSRPQYFRPA